jgi:hypothetical protein
MCQRIDICDRKEAMKSSFGKVCRHDRRSFIGGSDARIIMGNDAEALVRLWREKRGEAELKGLVPDDAQQAIGHGICAKRSKAGAITFELLKREEGNATV